jgi:hypothetical protein
MRESAVARTVLSRIVQDGRLARRGQPLAPGKSVVVSRPLDVQTIHALAFALAPAPTALEGSRRRSITLSPRRNAMTVPSSGVG